MKIRGKMKQGKVKISNRTRAKRDHFEINLNSNSSACSGESTILSGRRPVHNMDFKRNIRKYLRHPERPERCSNLDISLKAGFTFLMLAPSSMLILCREPAPRLWWREATRKTRKMLKLRQVNAPPISRLWWKWNLLFVCCLPVCFCSLGLHPLQFRLLVHTQNLIFLKRWNMENMLASVWELLHSAHIWGCTSRSVQFWAIE